MSAAFHVNVDIDNLGGMLSYVHSDLIKAVAVAVSQTANETASAWQADIYQNVPQHFAPEKRDAIIASIMAKAGGNEARIWSDDETVYQIEEGFPERDLKVMLQTSRRTRLGKNGKKYLIIPFRHNTPGNSATTNAMPKHVYDMALKMGTSRITGATTRVSATGHTVPQNTYAWDKTGSEFTRGKKKYLSIGPLPEGLAPKLKPHNTTDIYAGMRRFDTSTGKAKSSAYLTFRVMQEDQTGKWIVKAKPAKHIARDLAAKIDGVFFANLVNALSSLQ